MILPAAWPRADGSAGRAVSASETRRDIGFSLLVCGVLAVPARLLAGGAGWQVHPLAVLVMIAVAFDLRRATRARMGVPEMLCGGAAALLLAGPATGFAVLALLPLAVIAARRGRHGVIAAFMLAGLAAWALQDGPFGQAMAGAFIAAEARLLQTMLEMIDLPALRDGTTLALVDGRSLVILRGCSLESMVLPTVLGALAVRRLGLRLEMWPRPAAVLLPLGLVAALNMARLLAMSMSAQLYAVLHGDAGLIVLEVVMILPIGVALLPDVLRADGVVPVLGWRSGLQPVVAGAAIAAVAFGLLAQSLAVPAAHHPLAERGFAPVRSVALVEGGSLAMQLWRNAAGCSVYAADFEMPDATLPLIRRHLPRDADADADAAWIWWLGTRRMPQMSPLGVNAWRLAGKLVGGTAPKAWITVDPGRCLAV